MGDGGVVHEACIPKLSRKQGCTLEFLIPMFKLWVFSPEFASLQGSIN